MTDAERREIVEQCARVAEFLGEQFESGSIQFISSEPAKYDAMQERAGGCRQSAKAIRSLSPPDTGEGESALSDRDARSDELVEAVAQAICCPSVCEVQGYQRNDRLRELHAKTTPGEWLAFDDGWGEYPIQVPSDHHRSATVVTVTATSKTKENSAFIAAAHNDMPALLDEIDRLTALVREAEHIAKHWVCTDGDCATPIVWRSFLSRLEGK